MKQFLLFFAILVQSAFAKSTIEQSWQNTGLNFNKTVYGVFNNTNCKSSPRQLLGCYHLLNQALWLINPQNFGFLMMDYSGARVEYHPQWYKDYETYHKEKRSYYNYLYKAVSSFQYAELEKLDFSSHQLLSELEISVVKNNNNAYIASILFNAYLSVAYDPHTRIQPKQVSAEQDKRNEGMKAFGFIYYMVDQEKFIVTKVHAGSNAEANKLSPGEIIKSVNGKTKYADWRKELAYNNEVTLVTNRKKYQLKKTEIEVPKVTSKIWGEIGLLDIRSFGFNGACDDVIKNLQTMSKSVKKLIIDLRGNPGGFVHEGRCIQEIFLEKDSISFATVSLGDKKIEAKVKRTNRTRWADVPLVVLIDGNSASMSEIMAHYLQAYGKAVVVSQLSFGKGSMQGVNNLRDNSKINLISTQAVVYGPDAVTMHTHGVKPNFEAPRFYGKPLSEYERETDIYELVVKMPRDDVKWQPRDQLFAEINNCYDSAKVTQVYKKASAIEKLIFDNQIETAKVVLGCFDRNLDRIDLPASSRYPIVKQ